LSLEIKTLSETEILSYIDVQIRRERHSYLESAFVFVLILAIFGTIFAMFAIWMSLISLPSGIVLLLSTILFYRKRNRVILEKHQIDVAAARENTAFLSAIRKLASLTGEEVWMLDEFKDRLQYIEDTLSGNNY